MPWALVLAMMMRQAATRNAVPPRYPHFDTTSVVTFPFHDSELLQRHQHDAGSAWVTPTARVGDSLPLFIYLHGLNRFRHHRRWMHGSQYDMRTIVGPLALDGRIGPMIVAVPQTTGDSALRDSTIYANFDVAGFVDAIDRAVRARGVRVDRSRVIYSAHSASGCALGNGLFSGIGSSAVQTVLDIDCCMNADFGRVLASAPANQRVIVVYQDAMWERDYAEFTESFRRSSAASTDPSMRVLERIEAHGADAHNDMVALTLRRWLPMLVPPREAFRVNAP